MRLGDDLSGPGPRPSRRARHPDGRPTEEVPAEGDLLAHRTAEEVADRAAGLATDDVEAGDLERRVDRVDRGRDVEHAAEAGAGASVSRPRVAVTSRRRPFRSPRVLAGQGLGDGAQPREVRLVGVGLAQADAAVGVDLDDRAQGPGWCTPTTLSRGDPGRRPV